MALSGAERVRRCRERKMARLGIERKRPFRHCVRHSDDVIVSTARKYNSLLDFRIKEPKIYAAARRRGMVDGFAWMKRGGDRFSWTKELCEKESMKFTGMGRVGFMKGSRSAYRASIKNGWIDLFYWLGSKQNPHTDKIYVCYVYEFVDFHAVYVGLTINPTQRDNSHRMAPKGKKSAVLKFAELHGCVIPKMTILHKNLSCTQAQECEDFYVKKFRRLGWNVLNRGRTGVGIGSVGSTAFKWTKPKVFEEAKKYGTRKHFEKGCSSAYEVARKNRWLDEMTWMPKRRNRHG